MADLWVTTLYLEKLTAQTTIVQRTSYGGPARDGKSQCEAVMSMGAPAGAFVNIANVGVDSIKQSRDSERKHMQDLNERLASYIEKVRFLEAQNSKLAEELNRLKKIWCKETRNVKEEHQEDLVYKRQVLYDAEKEKAHMVIRCAILEEQIEDIRTEVGEATQCHGERIEKQAQQLSNYEAELKLVRRRIEMLETDHENDKKKIVMLSDALKRARTNLNNESTAHVDAENNRQYLNEELVFFKSLREKEMKELAALANSNTVSENLEYWKSEMANSISEIQTTYDEKMDQMRAGLNEYYKMKIQEFHAGATRLDTETVHAKQESKRLRKQITELRDHMCDVEDRNSELGGELANEKRKFKETERDFGEANCELKREVATEGAKIEVMFKGLEDLMNTKLDLELEIAAFEKLLEGAENRVGLQQIVEMIINIAEEKACPKPDPPSNSVPKVDHRLAKGKFLINHQGNVKIVDCSSDGNYISLQNIGKKEQSLGGWRVQRDIDGAKPASCTFESDFKISPGGKVNVYAKTLKPGQAGTNDIEVDIDTWGIHPNNCITLRNPDTDKYWATYQQSHENESNGDASDCGQV